MIVATWEPAGKGVDVTHCVVGATSYRAHSSHGSGHKLARIMASDHLPDDVLVVQDLAGKELYRFSSFHAAAQYSIREGKNGERLVRLAVGDYALDR